MNKISILCFSLTGFQTGQKLAEKLNHMGYEVLLDSKSKYIPESIQEGHAEWTERQFQEADAIIFIGACGIAVRSIAPFVKSKKTDPAVLVLDECGKYVISLLSGHLGGANELTDTVAEIVGGIPVITTATDIHRKFAVDVFAKKNRCDIFPMDAAKQFSAALLEDRPVGFYSDFPYVGTIPQGVAECDCEGRVIGVKNEQSLESAEDGVQKPLEIGVAVSIDKSCKPFPVTVHIVPKILSLGIGCRKGKSAKDIQNAVLASLKEANIFLQAIAEAVSIDLKKEEQGILEFSERFQIPFRTFSEEVLQAVAGDFSASTFVQGVTGVDNVCERSCVFASNYGKLIQKKKAMDGVTTALAMKDWSVHFE